MPENEDKIKKLYDTFVSDGYDMESEEDFRKNLSDSTKRKAAYDALRFGEASGLAKQVYLTNFYNNL